MSLLVPTHIENRRYDAEFRARGYHLTHAPLAFANHPETSSKPTPNPIQKRPKTTCGVGISANTSCGHPELPRTPPPYSGRKDRPATSGLVRLPMSPVSTFAPPAHRILFPISESRRLSSPLHLSDPHRLDLPGVVLWQFPIFLRATK